MPLSHPVKELPAIIVLLTLDGPVRQAPGRLQHRVDKQGGGDTGKVDPAPALLTALPRQVGKPVQQRLRLRQEPLPWGVRLIPCLVRRNRESPGTAPAPRWPGSSWAGPGTGPGPPGSQSHSELRLRRIAGISDPVLPMRSSRLSLFRLPIFVCIFRPLRQKRQAPLVPETQNEIMSLNYIIFDMESKCILYFSSRLRHDSIIYNKTAVFGKKSGYLPREEHHGLF